jgi:hypothetical protein
MRVEFDKDNPDWLLCPACRSRCLHHATVTVFDRPQEDAPSRAVAVDRGKVRHKDRPQIERANPSNRRDGIAIRFWCESCSALSELAIAQHKGTTNVEWRTVARRLGD